MRAYANFRVRSFVDLTFTKIIEKELEIKSFQIEQIKDLKI